MERVRHQNVVDVDSDIRIRRTHHGKLSKEIIIAGRRYPGQSLQRAEWVISQHRGRLLDFGADNGCLIDCGRVRAAKYSPLTSMTSVRRKLSAAIEIEISLLSAAPVTTTGMVRSRYPTALQRKV